MISLRPRLRLVLGAFLAAAAAGCPPENNNPDSGLPDSGTVTVVVTPSSIGSLDVIVHDPAATNDQSETAIALNTTPTGGYPAGAIVVVGYNDARGFDESPMSISGISRSLDGGAGWSEVPVGPGGTGLLPSVTNGLVAGDPDIKYDPTRGIFIYASIFVRPDGTQGLAIHHSNADASSWTGPVEVAPTFVANAIADKELIDVNPATGRILIVWVNFPNVGTESIRSTFSDDLGATWSAAVTLATGSFHEPVPRFIPGTTNANSTVYAVWSFRVSATTANIQCSRSTNGGASWSAPVNLDSASFQSEDEILGLDRVGSTPWMDVDHTSGRVYVVYQRNNATGTGDIALRSFVGACATAAPVLLGSDSGNDRAQSNAFVAVDQSTKRVHVGFYDQGLLPTGELTQVLHTYSDDQGTTWSPPTPLNDRPFHAAYGNSEGQPNLGDYNQGVAFGGKLYTAFGATAVAPRFDDGQAPAAAYAMISPSTYFDVTPDAQKTAPLRLVSESTSDATFCGAGSNGAADPGETVDVRVTIENYVANAVNGAATITGIQGSLRTNTNGVSIQQASAAFSDLAPLAQASAVWSISLSKSFVPGTFIDFVLEMTTGQGSTALPFRVATGTPGTPQSLMNETFTTTTITTTSPPTASSWRSVVTSDAGSAWAINQVLTPGNNAAFHSEAPAAYSWVYLLSHGVSIPTTPGASLISLDFDVAYNLEDNPARAVQAWDGVFLSLYDNTPGFTPRTVLAEAFAESIRTGAANHYPKRIFWAGAGNNPNYAKDMSVWSGRSGALTGGVPPPIHVAMRFPGDGATGHTVHLFFQYTSNNTASCATGTCGFALDNVVMNLVPIVSGSCVGVCGDGVVGPGEQCDDGNPDAGGCCSPTCLFADAGTVCRPAIANCDKAEVCSGAAGACPVDDIADAGTKCTQGCGCVASGGDSSLAPVFAGLIALAVLARMARRRASVGAR